MMTFSTIPGGEPVFLMACCILAIFYFLTGSGFLRSSFIHRIRMAPQEEKAGILIRAFTGVTFALSTISIMYNEKFWPMREPLLYISVFALSVLMFFSLLFLEKAEPASNRYIIFRAVIFSALLMYFIVTPLSKRLEWKYDDQYYREILQYSLENPQDKDARKSVVDYERRREGLPPSDE